MGSDVMRHYESFKEKKKVREKKNEKEKDNKTKAAHLYRTLVGLYPSPLSLLLSIPPLLLVSMAGYADQMERENPIFNQASIGLTLSSS